MSLHEIVIKFIGDFKREKSIVRDEAKKLKGKENFKKKFGFYPDEIKNPQQPPTNPQQPNNINMRR